MEEIKALPFSAVWDMYCEMQGVPLRDERLTEFKKYEKEVLVSR